MNDHEMMKFIVLMMRRISTRPTKVPLKSFCRHLDLDPFEFMFGRITFAKAAGISTKIARTRLAQLIGLGYVEEVVSKRASNFRVYRLVTEALCRNSGQHQGHLEGQRADKDEDLLFGHKQETKNQEEKNIEEAFYSASAPFPVEGEDVTVILAYCEMQKLDIKSSLIERWIAQYGLDNVLGTISLMVSSKTFVKNKEAWMESALRGKYFEESKNREVNSRFAKEFKKSHKWNDLTLTQRYCRHEPSKKEYYFSLPPGTFQEILKNCFSQYDGIGTT